MSATNTHRPLTTTSSLKELIMADANLKPRRARDEPPTFISAALERAPATASPQEQHRRLAFPWMQVTDALLERIGFLPGQRVMFSVDHRLGHITISLDRNYTIAGKPMTQQIRQRSSLSID
jgi:toxic protein SymE